MKYLNAVPLTRGIEDEVTFATPAQLAELLRRDELDAALVSIAEVLLNDRYDILDGIAVASLGEVYSVLLAHCVPLAEIEGSLLPHRLVVRAESAESSAGGTRVETGIQAAGRSMNPPRNRMRCCSSATRRLIFNARPHVHDILDLGTAWFELTKLPFVFAVWALRRGIENQALRRDLIREAKHFGLETLDYLIETREEYDEDFRRDYLGWHVHYHLAADEKRGIAKFGELLRKHGLGPVYEPKYVL